MTDTVMLFHFYLDAWSYCYRHGINQSLIKRKDWKTWELTVPESNNE